MLSGLGAGYYSVTISGNTNDSLVLSISLIVPAEITLTANQTPATNGESNGIVTVIVSGGEEPYHYQWEDDPFNNSSTLHNIPSGDYPVIITDARGCIRTITITVDNITGISSINQSDFLKIHPTLTNNEVYLTATKQLGLTAISIMDMYGQTLENHQFTELKEFHLDLSSFPNGMYLITINGEYGKWEQRIIKVK